MCSSRHLVYSWNRDSAFPEVSASECINNGPWMVCVHSEWWDWMTTAYSGSNISSWCWILNKLSPFNITTLNKLSSFRVQCDWFWCLEEHQSTPCLSMEQSTLPSQKRLHPNAHLLDVGYWISCLHSVSPHWISCLHSGSSVIEWFWCWLFI